MMVSGRGLRNGEGETEFQVLGVVVSIQVVGLG